jgi:hypothetical protein
MATGMDLVMKVLLSVGAEVARGQRRVEEGPRRVVVVAVATPATS